MARPKSTVEWCSKSDDTPPGLYDVAKRRMEPFVSFYGQFIRTVTLDQLAMSAYLQGCRDMAQVAVQEALEMDEQNQGPLNYEI